MSSNRHSDGTSNSTTESAADRRREIVKASASLFDSQGYHQTSMQDIAAAIGLSKPTVYHYFSSKSEVLYWIHDEFIGLLLSRHIERVSLSSIRPSHQLLEIMTDILEVMRTHGGHVRVFFEHHRELDESDELEVRQKRDEYESLVEGVISDGIKNGDFREGLDPKLATLFLFGACNWAYKWYRIDGALEPRQIAYVFWTFLMEGIGSKRVADTTHGADDH